MTIQQLGLRDKFIVSLILEKPEELLIYNSFNGKVLRVKNPLKEATVQLLVNYVKSEGVSNEDGTIYRAVMTADEIMQMLYVPRSGKLTPLYEKIVSFILQ